MSEPLISDEEIHAIYAEYAYRSVDSAIPARRIIAMTRARLAETLDGIVRDFGKPRSQYQEGLVDGYNRAARIVSGKGGEP